MYGSSEVIYLVPKEAKKAGRICAYLIALKPWHDGMCHLLCCSDTSEEAPSNISPVLPMLVQGDGYKTLLLAVNIRLGRGGLAMVSCLCAFASTLEGSGKQGGRVLTAAQSCRTEPCITATSLRFTVSSTLEYRHNWEPPVIGDVPSSTAQQEDPKAMHWLKVPSARGRSLQYGGGLPFTHQKPDGMFCSDLYCSNYRIAPLIPEDLCLIFNEKTYL